MLEKLARVLNPEKIDGYVEKQLGERPEMLASELPLDTTDDFVKMIYVRLYGQRKKHEVCSECKRDHTEGRLPIYGFYNTKEGTKVGWIF